MSRLLLLFILIATSACNDSSDTNSAAEINSEPSNTLKWSRSFQYNSADTECVVTNPPEELKLPTFYKKYCSLYGLPIVSSEKVQDKALEVAWIQASKMLELRHDVLKTIAEAGVVLAIMSVDEVPADIPEYEGSETNRGLGPTDDVPVSMSAEENILCFSEDIYKGASIFIHELAHSFHEMGVNKINNDFDEELQRLYQSAKSSGLWANTYSMVNHGEYWAYGVQSYFDLMDDEPETLAMNTRVKLLDYDPELYMLIQNNLLTTEVIALCPATSNQS
jgi:hypothetical protein